MAVEYGPDKIRNVILLSHHGSGKTSLGESMLFASGAIKRLGSVEDGTTTSDWDPSEIERHMSINLSLLPLVWKETKINLIDTPGYADFTTEIKCGLRVSEGAVIVICAVSGVEVDTERVWDYVEGANMPRLLFINRMDKDNANFFAALEEIHKKLGTKCLPVTLPIGSQSDFQGIVDLVSMKGYIGTSLEETAIPSSLGEQATSYREKLVEAAVETDDALLTRYLEGEEISNEEILGAVKKATISGKLVPVFAGSALPGIGTSSLLNAICDFLPSPQEQGSIAAINPVTKEKEEVKPARGEPLTCLVFKTTADPYVGKLNYFRVYSGSLPGNSQVWNATKNSMERVAQLFTLRGKNQETVPEVVAGDIGAVARLSLTTTGDTICSPEHRLLLEGIEFPQVNLTMAVQPQTKADLDKMGTILPRICEEDPALRMQREQDTNEFLISGIGDAHLEMVREKAQRKFGVKLILTPPKVPYKETVTAATEAEYKHKKQTGGHGQYGHVLLKVEPLPRGSGFEFVEKVIGGAIPRNYIPAVEKGVNEARQQGVLAGYPVIDTRVTLYDGSFHPVDSSDICFKIAGAQALKKGLSQGQPVLLEPIMNLAVTAPEEFTGDLTGDLNSRRGRVLGIEPEGKNITIQAQAPYAELLDYATGLRSITQGRASFTMESSHYEEVPAYITQKIVAPAKEKA